MIEAIGDAGSLRDLQRYVGAVLDARTKLASPKPSRRGRKPKVGLRQVLNTIRYLAQRG